MSLNERKDSRIQENALDLSAEQTEALKQLRTTLGAEFSDPYTDFALFRFLRFNSFNVDSAATHWKNYLNWRISNNIDNILKKQPNNIETINILCPYSYHKFDKDNRPIYWEKTGKLKCDALSDENIISVKDFIDSHIWGMEYIYQQCYNKSLEFGRRIDQFTSVLDMDGLGFQHRALFTILKSCMDTDNLYFPERIAKLYVLNTPWVAPTLFQLVSPILPAAVKEKVYIVQGNPNSFLSQQIDKSNLPVEYGGECTCNNKVGGCIPELDATELVRNARKVDGLDSELVKTEYTREISCDEKGGTFTWFFRCEDDMDIDFSVAIIDPNNPNKPPVWAKQSSRCPTSKGSYESKEAAKLIFKWDNSFSWMNNKTIRYSISMVSAADLLALNSQTGK